MAVAEGLKVEFISHKNFYSTHLHNPIIIQALSHA